MSAYQTTPNQATTGKPDGNRWTGRKSIATALIVSLLGMSYQGPLLANPPAPVPVPANTAAAQAAFQDAKAYAPARNTGAAGAITIPSANAQLPYFTNTAPSQSGLFANGQGATAGPGASKSLGCAGLPTGGGSFNEQECNAINFMTQSPTTRVTYTLTPTDNVITRSHAIVLNPQPLVGNGSLQGNYSACTTSTVTSAPAMQNEICHDSATIESSTCNIPAKVIVVPGPATYECDRVDTATGYGERTDDYCIFLATTPSCTFVSSAPPTTTCIGSSCVTLTTTYSCTDEPPITPGIRQFPGPPIVQSDTLDVSACAAKAASPDCQQQSETCVEGPETRVIGGLPITKACWKFERTYQCASTPNTAECSVLAARGCTEFGTPVCADTLPSGICGSTQRSFQCQFQAGGTSTVANCGVQAFCLDGSCFDTSHPNDADFALATSGMEAAREAGVYFDQSSFQLFKGKSDTCTKTLGGLGNCCNSNPRTQTSNAILSQASGAALKVGGEIFKTGSAYVYDSISGLMAQGGAAMAGAGGSCAAASTFDVMGAQFSFSTASGFEFIAFDPVSFAIAIAVMVVVQLLSCTKPEKTLAIKRGQNLCVYVGDQCTTRVLGLCVTRTQTHCCFNSRLSRIINQQGRTQLGRTFGTPDAPNCNGFTEADINALDFSTMDLSEFFNEIVARTPDEIFRGNKNLELVNKRTQNYIINGSQNSPPPVYTGPPNGP